MSFYSYSTLIFYGFKIRFYSFIKALKSGILVKIVSKNLKARLTSPQNTFNFVYIFPVSHPGCGVLKYFLEIFYNRVGGGAKKNIK